MSSITKSTNFLFAVPVLLVSSISIANAAPITDTSVEFNFSGTSQQFETSSGVNKVYIEAWGAQGNSNSGNVSGGRGGYAAGELGVNENQKLNVRVGDGGKVTSLGGFNGGGNAGSAPDSRQQGGGGGGASDVRVNGSSTANRVIVAGGGGGAGGNRIVGIGAGTGGGGGAGYYGGGGGASYINSSSDISSAKGGDQTTGGQGGATNTPQSGGKPGTAGSLAQGGSGGNTISNKQTGSNTAASNNSGAGGGLVGGSGNVTGSLTGGGGGGGSSYIGGVTNAITNSGSQAGSGKVQISYNLPELFSTPVAGSLIDFGSVNDSLLLTSAIALSNIGGWGTYIDISGANFTGLDSSAFSISGDLSATLDDVGTEELYDLIFDAANLAVGLYESTLEFTTTSGRIAYHLQATVPGSGNVPEPSIIALMFVGLIGVGFFGRRSRK